MRIKDIDFEAIKSMSEEQQQQAYYVLAKRANQRMRDIQKGGYYSGASKKAQRWNEANYGRTNFVQSKNLSGIDLKEGLKQLQKFYEAKTSTAKGIKRAEKKSLEKLESQFEDNASARKLVKLLKNKEQKKNFYTFLSSEEFKNYAKYVPSEQLIEDFTNASDSGYSIEQIMQQYDEFMNNEMTFEQVAERRNNGGELLH